MKTIIKTTSAIFVFFLTVISAHAQYGGSASVRIKDKNGRTSVANTTVPCIYDSESEAKSKLEDHLRRQKGVYGEYLSSISYSIDRCSNNGTHSYGGSASVRIKDQDGRISVANTTVPCIYDSVSEAKSKLEDALRRKKGVYGEYVSSIAYDIDRRKK